MSPAAIPGVLPIICHRFRFTARDGRGGVNAASADTTLLLATNAGPFLVTSPNTAVTWKGLSNQTITWDPANTQSAPVSAANVKISLSTDGGYTYPYVLAESTPNDGSEALIVPNVGTAHARVKIEAVGNVFFDLSNADVTIQAVPVVTSSLGAGGSQSVQYSDPLSPDVIVTATDPDTLGSNLTASAVGLPAGMSLALVSTSGGSTLPGSRAWKVAGATTAKDSEAERTMRGIRRAKGIAPNGKAPTLTPPFGWPDHWAHHRTLSYDGVTHCASSQQEYNSHAV